jgi:RNA polymerase sigma factor (sigma-70 family)
MFLLTADRAEAEDLVQEALARAYERWDRIGSMERPDGYVYRIAVNLYRKRVRRSALLRRLVPHPGEPVDPADVAGTRDDLVRALRSLSAEQRAALVLVDWLGYDAEEAGRLLGIEAVSVRGRLHRARASLRAVLGRTQDE